MSSVNLLDGLIGGIRQIYLAGVEATFKRALDFTDMASIKRMRAV